MFLGWLWMLLPVALVVVAAVVVAQMAGRGDGSDAARQALARRFADGEIDEKEYRERSATLDTLGPARSGLVWGPGLILTGVVVLLVLLVVTALAWGAMDPGWMRGHMWW